VSLYNAWAMDGRHVVMEATQSAAFVEMWEHVAAHYLPQGRVFTAVDGGCGNGWASRRMAEHARCGAVDAVDAAAVMIDRARDLSRDYSKVRCHVGDIMTWQPEEAVDVVNLCETLYLLDDPAAALAHVADGWLKPGGVVMCSMECYAENSLSLAWQAHLGIRMHCESAAKWKCVLAMCSRRVL